MPDGTCCERSYYSDSDPAPCFLPQKAVPHPDFGFPAAILPAVVVEGDTTIHRLVDNLDRGFLLGRIAEVMASEAKTEIRASERPNFVRGIVPLEDCGIDLARTL
ncbi:MAG: hypothetical protein WB660_12780 [Candidatus Sulfotelmatobacter sp.]